MLTTYTLFLHRDGQASPAFEPYLAKNPAEALARAQNLLAADAAITAVAVQFGDRHLFTVERGPRGAEAKAI